MTNIPYSVAPPQRMYYLKEKNPTHVMSSVSHPGLFLTEEIWEHPEGPTKGASGGWLLCHRQEYHWPFANDNLGH